MTDRPAQAFNIELHEQAERQIREHVNNFAAALLLQSKVLAFQRKADVVLSVHVDEALKIIQLEQKQTWSKTLMTIVGGGLFGAFIPGFITELSGSRNVLLIVIYTILGFIGMILTF